MRNGAFTSIGECATDDDWNWGTWCGISAFFLRGAVMFFVVLDRWIPHRYQVVLQRRPSSRTWIRGFLLTHTVSGLVHALDLF